MARWRKINEFLVVSGVGKKQTGFGAFLADGSLDTRENCDIEMDLEIERGQERNCDQVDLIGEPVKTRFRRFRLTYNQPTAKQAFRMIAYKEGAVTSPTGSPSDAVFTIERTGTVSGGTFVLSFDFEGKSGSSKPIAFSATAAQIQAALTDRSSNIGKVILSGDVVVTGDWTTGIVLTFAKRLGKADLPLLGVDDALITGGGTVDITETTAGDQYYHTAQRSADGTKPLFSVATGEKSGSIATKKYGDAVVESIDFTLSADQTNVTMVVVIACNFNPDIITGFSVPACVNLPAIKTVDARLLIDSSYQQRDLVNHAITLNDNVPTAAAFAYDDIDVTEAFLRGDQPAQEKTTEIYGDENHDLHILAENEHIEGNEVEFITHLGNPGNRVSIIAPEAKIKPQQRLNGFAGAANQSTVRITGTPYGITGLPVRYEARLNQSTAFLQNG